MPRRDLRLLVLLAVLAMVWLLVESVAGVSEGVAMLAPALVVALPLLFGRYVGEDVIARLRVARSAPKASRRIPVVARARPAARVAVHGALLMGAHLAQRPPPALV